MKYYVRCYVTLNKSVINYLPRLSYHLLYGKRNPDFCKIWLVEHLSQYNVWPKHSLQIVLLKKILNSSFIMYLFLSFFYCVRVKCQQSLKIPKHFKTIDIYGRGFTFNWYLLN